MEANLPDSIDSGRRRRCFGGWIGAGSSQIEQKVKIPSTGKTQWRMY